MGALTFNRLLRLRNKLPLTRNFCFSERKNFTSCSCDDSNIEKSRKVLKVAIIGPPNVGKSTLLNQIVGRNVFAISCKVHTTRCSARAVKVVADTQLIFLDTPGLVTVKESQKHHLERTFLVSSEEAIQEADVIGVLHDASHKYTKFFLDPKVQRMLHMYPQKHTFLILNKIDVVKSKLDLLDCVRILTEQDKKKTSADDKLESSKISIEFDENRTGWPYFQEVFMVSALTGDGVGDIQAYLLKQAKPGKWVFPESSITDQDEKKIIEDTVFSKLLDHLPHIVPYQLKVEMDYLKFTEEGSVTVIARIIAKNLRTKKLVLGGGGRRIKIIAQDVEQCLRKFFLKDVLVKLIVDEKFIIQDTIA